MTTSQDLQPPHSAEEWKQAMQQFRARARLLYESQSERIHCLEASINKQIEGIAFEAGGANRNPAAANEDEQEELRNQLSKCRDLLSARADELKQLRSQLATQFETSGEVDVENLLEELSELKTERKDLITRLADSERQSEQAAATDVEQLDDLRKRFEMAVQEIRELKSKNGELEHQSAVCRPNETAAPSSGGFDWEQQKVRLMQQLEDSCDDESFNANDKLTVEGTIHITDQVIADKDGEIKELKRQLEEQTNTVGDNGPAAIGDVLDRDELIQEERNKLNRLQEEWRDKLRQAEIDVSVERAKLARERVALEGKLRDLESEQKAILARSDDGGGEKDDKPQTGRWLSRLGLKEDD